MAALEASPSAMLVVKDGKITHFNSLAAELFGCRKNASPVGIIPDYLLAEKTENFVSSTIIKDKCYLVRVVSQDGERYFSLEPKASASLSTELISDSLLSRMLSTLFNIGLSADRIALSIPENDSRAENYLSILNHNYFSMRHALTNISTSIALKKNTLPFNFQVTDLHSLCSELCATTAIMCRSRKLDIRFSSSLKELYAWVDSEKVERIILNLLSNAIANTPTGGSVCLGLEKRGDKAYISVDDTGKGIPPAIMAKIFNAYEREPDLSEMADFGGGLGLGIAQGLAEAHDGALIIESREGKGTSVRLMLPLKSEHFNLLESPVPPYFNSGMLMILTQLSEVLDKESYDNKFRG